MSDTYKPDVHQFFSRVYWEPGNRQGIEVELTTEEKFHKLFNYIEDLEYRIKELEENQ